jgi:Arm DNA-binding domain
MGTLTAKASRTPNPAKYSDGDGLQLLVSSNTSKAWVYRYTLNGRSRELGLGSATAIPLARARELAAAARTLRAQGIDPIEHRKAQREVARTKTIKPVTLCGCVKQFIATNEIGWSKGHPAPIREPV